MGDALSNNRREQDKVDAYWNYIGSLVSYLRMPTEEGLCKVEGCRNALNSALRYSQVKSDERKYLRSLEGRDKQVWAELLFRVQADAPQHFRSVKELSPFPDHLMVTVEYGTAFSNIKGGFEQIADLVILQQGWKIYDCDTYVIFVPSGLNFSDSEVYWMACGISGVSGPRSL